MRKSSFTPSAPKSIERPPCPQCGASLMLTRIEPGAPGIDQRSFECNGCGYCETVQVKYW